MRCPLSSCQKVMQLDTTTMLDALLQSSGRGQGNGRVRYVDSSGHDRWVPFVRLSAYPCPRRARKAPVLTL